MPLKTSEIWLCLSQRTNNLLHLLQVTKSKSLFLASLWSSPGHRSSVIRVMGVRMRQQEQQLAQGQEGLAVSHSPPLLHAATGVQGWTEWMQHHLLNKKQLRRDLSHQESRGQNRKAYLEGSCKWGGEVFAQGIRIIRCKGRKKPGDWSVKKCNAFINSKTESCSKNPDEKIIYIYMHIYIACKSKWTYVKVK